MTLGETDAARARVTDRLASSGKRCLEIVDAPGLQYRFNPHVVWGPTFRSGTVEGSFDIRLGEGAVFYHEWRDAASPYRAGPSLRIEADGRLVAGGRTLLGVPRNEWIRIEIHARLGKDADGTWDLRVHLPGSAEMLEYEKLPGHPRFRELRWVGFVADGDAKATTWIDRFHLGRR